MEEYNLKEFWQEIHTETEVKPVYVREVIRKKHCNVISKVTFPHYSFARREDTRNICKIYSSQETNGEHAECISPSFRGMAVAHLLQVWGLAHPVLWQRSLALCQQYQFVPGTSASVGWSRGG